MLRGWPRKVLGGEDVKEHGLLPCSSCQAESSFAGMKEGGRFLPFLVWQLQFLGFVGAVQGRGWSLGWSQRLLLDSGISRIASEGKRGLIIPSSSSMPGSLPAWRSCNPSLCPYD